jgi:hypothetical protein
MKRFALAFLLSTQVVMPALAAGHSPVTAAATLAPAARVQTAGTTTLTGKISDSLCKAKHEEAAEGQGKMSDHDCTVSCVKGGSKYVLLVNEKVYQIANQNFADLATHAGHSVKVTGDVKGEQITVSKIEM